MSVKSICVFCGSRPGDNPAFTATAEAMGSGIAARGWRLVYGAGDVGLMGRRYPAASGGLGSRQDRPHHLYRDRNHARA